MANTSQDSVSSHSQAIPAIKPRRSRKPPMLKAEVITRRVQKQSKRRIAKELGITRNTVATILEESHIEQHLQAFQVESVGLVPASLQVYRDRLAKGSEFVATKVLENTIWPLTQKSKGADLGAVFSGCQVLIQQAAASTLHKDAAELSTNATPQITQATDSKQDKP